MRVVVATRNAGKIREFRDLLGGGGIVWVDLAEFGMTPDVHESGATFHDNACLKASEYARSTGCWALADDSGLEVEALDWRPGVLSARWAEHHGAGRGDADNNRLLLKQMSSLDEQRRSARFVCVLALADPDGRIVLTTRDHVSGRIAFAPRGTGGFGYDPLFELPELGKTTAELPASEKHALSHRGKALRHMRTLMDQLGLRV
mgnify:CR=1 FL=1